MTGTGDAPNFAYTKSVIEYSTAADMPAVNTLMKELTNVTSLQVPSLAPGTVDLILGSDFTGLVPPQNPQATATPSHRGLAGVLGREPVRLGVRVRRGRPGPVQRRHHRRRGVHRRQLGLLRPAQSLTHWP